MSGSSDASALNLFYGADCLAREARDIGDWELASSAGDGANDMKGLGPAGDSLRQRSVRVVMG